MVHFNVVYTSGATITKQNHCIVFRQEGDHKSDCFPFRNLHPFCFVGKLPLIMAQAAIQNNVANFGD